MIYFVFFINLQCSDIDNISQKYKWHNVALTNMYLVETDIVSLLKLLTDLYIYLPVFTLNDDEFFQKFNLIYVKRILIAI